MIIYVSTVFIRIELHQINKIDFVKNRFSEKILVSFFLPNTIKLLGIFDFNISKVPSISNFLLNTTFKVKNRRIFRVHTTHIHTKNKYTLLRSKSEILKYIYYKYLHIICSYIKVT